MRRVVSLSLAVFCILLASVSFAADYDSPFAFYGKEYFNETEVLNAGETLKKLHAGNINIDEDVIPDGFGGTLVFDVDTETVVYRYNTPDISKIQKAYQEARKLYTNSLGKVLLADIVVEIAYIVIILLVGYGVITFAVKEIKKCIDDDSSQYYKNKNIFSCAVSICIVSIVAFHLVKAIEITHCYIPEDRPAIAVAKIYPVQCDVYKQSEINRLLQEYDSLYKSHDSH